MHIGPTLATVFEVCLLKS